jgi:hypothetical protein
MPQLDSDTFTYSDGDLATVSAGKWTNLSGPTNLVQVASNAIGPSAGSAAVVITTWSGSTVDQYGQIVISTLGDFGGITVRSNQTHTYYTFQFQNGAGTSEVYKVVLGTATMLSSTAITWSASDTAYIEIQGTTIITKQNGTNRHNFTDAAIASGSPGIDTYSNTTAWDNWAGGDFSVAGVGQSPSRLTLMGVR